MTALFTPAILPNGTATSQLTFTSIANTAATGPSSVLVTASGSGVTSKTATIALTVAVAGSIALTPGTNSVTIAQGLSGSIPVSVLRAGGFTGAITLNADNLPAGVTAAPVTIAAGSNVGTILLTATGTATTGPKPIVLRASGAGILDASQTIAVTVNPLEAIGLWFTASPAALAMAAGQAVQTTIAVARTGGFIGDVVFTLENAPSGMSITVNPATVTGNAATVTITATAAVAPGVYQVRLRGSSGARDNTVPLTVLVTS